MGRKLRVVFISRRNSLRSILAQACLSHLQTDKFTTLSCGQPGLVAEQVHPAAVGALSSASIALPSEPPKSWVSVLRPGAPAADFIITLDEEIVDLAPRWPGQPELATWPFPDLAIETDSEEVAIAAVRMLYSLRRRLELLINLPFTGADRTAIRSDIRDLAHWR